MGSHRDRRLAWDETIEGIRRGAGSLSLRDSTRLYGRLYELARLDGQWRLASFRAEFGDEWIVDLVHDLLAERREAIVGHPNPRALFLVSLKRRAIDRQRRAGSRVVEPDDGEGAAPEDDIIRDLDLKKVLKGLSERNQEIVVAVALGEDREAVAREHGTSRPNVDQIVSRTRKSAQGGEP